MRHSKWNKGLLMFFALTVAGCASTQLTREELGAQYPDIIKLEEGLDSARNDGINLLAPVLFESAQELFRSAHIAAISNEPEVANAASKKGLISLDKAKSVAEKSRDVFSEVLEARKRAIKVQAHQFYPEQFREYDEELVNASAYIEDNDIKKAKKRRKSILAAYANLELKALKHTTIAGAKSALARAVENDAEKYSPVTLAKAREELVKAQSVLDVDRTNLEKASAHAGEAVILANRSYYIAEAVKDIEKRDTTYENIILRHQSDIVSLGKAVNHNIHFDKSNNESIGELLTAIQKVVDNGEEQTARADNLEAKLNEVTDANKQNLAELKAKYKGEIENLDKTKAEIERMQREQREKFDRIQSMFTDNEANIFRQKNNVLISVHGFKFPSGSSEIRPDNFDLMNRIVTAIKEFNGSNIVISGHTDSTGSAAVNKSLSTKRAESVAKFFVDVAGLPSSQIEAKGFGQEKPVASNQSVDGRAKNRRVEILIVNE